MFTEIVSGIYSVEQQVAEGKNGIILGERGALAIDTGTDPAEGQAMADFIREQGCVPNRLIFTHGHGDHVLGSAAFKEAEVIAHKLTPVEIRRLLPKWVEMYGASAARLEAQIAWPTLTYSDELYIDLGDRHVRLFPTPGHSRDGVSVYVEEERLLFAGDSVVTGIVPAIGDGDSRVLEATVRSLLTMDIEILVPGHGAVVYGAEGVQDWLEWIINYLSGVRDFVREALDRGLPGDDAVDSVDYQKFIGSRLPSGKHGMPKRHRNTVKKIVEEESE